MTNFPAIPFQIRMNEWVTLFSIRCTYNSQTVVSLMALWNLGTTITKVLRLSYVNCREIILSFFITGAWKTEPCWGFKTLLMFVQFVFSQSNNSYFEFCMLESISWIAISLVFMSTFSLWLWLVRYQRGVFKK